MANTNHAFAPLELDTKTAQHIGEFFVVWGRVELELDSLFPILFRIDPTQSLCLTANLGTKAKIDSLRSALAMISSVLEPELVKELDDSLKITQELADKYRNFLAHGQPQQFRGEEFGEWVWTKWTARKELSAKLAPEDFGDHWRIAGAIAWMIAEGMHQNGMKAHLVLSKIGKRAWSQLCTVPAQNVQRVNRKGDFQ